MIFNKNYQIDKLKINLRKKQNKKNNFDYEVNIIEGYINRLYKKIENKKKLKPFINEDLFWIEEKNKVKKLVK